MKTATATALSFADVAVADGYVSKEAVEEAQLLYAAAKRRFPDATLADVMVRSGVLTREEAREIERRQGERLAAQAREDLPPEVAAAMAAPANRAGRFVKLEIVGRGGLGEVWRAYDPALRRVVAIKFVRSLAPESWRRFVQEAEILGRLQHPNIVPLLEIGDRFLVMPFIDGRTLDAAGVDTRGAAGAVRQAALALDHAHRQGVVHRDVKPANLLVAGGVVYVTDFGIAKEVRAREAMSTTGAIIGTPAYMSPEQVRGRRDIDARADIYALGATLYQLLGGRVPFASDDLFEMLRAIQEDEPPRLGGRVPRDLEAVARKAMEKSPSRRYATAADMAEDLARFLRGEPVRARPSGPMARAARRLARLRAPATLALAAAVLVGLAFAWLQPGGAGKEKQLAPQPVPTVKGKQDQQPELDHAGSNRMADWSQQALRRGDPDEALEAANRAIDLDPNNPGAYYTRGKLYWDTGRRAAAREDFRKYASFGTEYAKVVEAYLSGNGR